TAEDLETNEPSVIPAEQLRTALAAVRPGQEIVVAYEPVWAIGSGQAASPEQAEAVCAVLREVIREALGDDAAETTRVLYGGSVVSENVASFLREPNIDGALVGGASLKIEEFARIVRFEKHVGR
ncbi:triose-phosphate isomerase, partial [Leucobacter sp. M11]|uniref:triose-phosphate isomerase n=1 Tax=Leucobacter sp. M11 TaxID=2993565 RepID=UPI002D7E7AA7